MDNLWPDFADPTGDIKMPHEILNTQGSFLLQKTKGIIYAEVLKIETDGTWMTEDYDEIEGAFGFRFTIRSKLMDHYRFELFKIFHDFDCYPLTMLLDEKIYEELGLKKPIALARDEEEYFELLKKIFNSKRLITIVSVMLKVSTP